MNFAQMARFDKATSGTDVVAAFPEAIHGKTSKDPWDDTFLTWEIGHAASQRLAQSLTVVVVITGPSEDGIGAQTAVCLAQGKPAELLLPGRTESKTASTIEEIKTISPRTSVQFVQTDLASFASIRRAAATINNSVKKIDILINNAGIMAVAKLHSHPRRSRISIWCKLHWSFSAH